MSHSRRVPLIVLAIALVSAAVQAAAQQGRDRTPPSAEPVRSGHDDSVSDAVRRIERSNRGQVLSAERMQYDGRDVTRIKVVDDAGRVRIYMDDAKPKPYQRPQPQPQRSDDTPPSRRDND